MQENQEQQRQPPDVTTSSTTAAAASPGLNGPHAEEITPALRQRTISFPPTDPEHAAEQPDQDLITMHLSIRCFADYLLLFATEDATCAPGVVVRYDAPALGPSAFMYDGETPSLDVTVLIGLRDHPLTNMLASSIAHRIRRYGESRPLLMGLSVVQTGKKLKSGAAKKAFLSFVASELVQLAGAGREENRKEM